MAARSDPAWGSVKHGPGRLSVQHRKKVFALDVLACLVEHRPRRKGRTRQSARRSGKFGQDDDVFHCTKPLSAVGFWYVEPG